MKIIYDPKKDIVSIWLSEKPPKSRSINQNDLVFNYDIDGNIVKLEITNARTRVDNPQIIEYSINMSTSESFNLEQRRNFLDMSLEERRKILAQQAEDLLEHYQNEQEWKEFLNGDIVEY